ncbi:hypothetical protein ACQPYK_47385 [Streptosporangium sp. CA-135522]|uniref:hypothetical protein n=1 Tax=Streptosporangium sp. CA-135522 TaxID=3240072 RepID=UPI003D8F207B
MSEFPIGAGERPDSSGQARTTTERAGAAAGEVAETAKGRTQVVAREARQQAQHVVGQLRDRVNEQARHQSRPGRQGHRPARDQSRQVTSSDRSSFGS